VILQSIKLNNAAYIFASTVSCQRFRQCL